MNNFETACNFLQNFPSPTAYTRMRCGLFFVTIRLCSRSISVSVTESKEHGEIRRQFSYSAPELNSLKSILLQPNRQASINNFRASSFILEPVPILNCDQQTFC